MRADRLVSLALLLQARGRVTGRALELSAFGSTNRAAFAALLGPAK